MTTSGGTIGKGMRFHGTLGGSGSLTVEGELEGELALERVTVQASGVLRGKAEVAEAVLLGWVEGSVSATERVHVGRTARIEGELSAPSLVIEEGATLVGRVSMPLDLPEGEVGA